MSDEWNDNRSNNFLFYQPNAIYKNVEYYRECRLWYDLWHRATLWAVTDAENDSPASILVVGM